VAIAFMQIVTDITGLTGVSIELSLFLAEVSLNKRSMGEFFY
jgi:hypothetical protein